MGPASPELWLTVRGVLHIRGRGIVVTGRLEGTGQLSVGDAVLCEGQGQGWQVDGIEQRGTALTTASAGSNIGILLQNGPPAEMLRGRTLLFTTNAAAGQPNVPFTDLAPKKKRWRP
jgi:translation elongation factor EF-Tu-like GTPase